MNSLKPLQWVVILVGSSLAIYLAYTHLQYFGNVSFLGAVVLLEIIIASLWKYDERLFALLFITFAWAGMRVPMQSAGITGRWVVLVAGSMFGFMVWLRAPRGPFRSIHLIAFFCVCTAFVSATVSPFVQMASFKALSLALLFLYCAAGARLAVLGREERFFQGLLLGCEVAVYFTAICYLVLRQGVLGNPNSLGAVVGIGLFPLLLWGWQTSDGPAIKVRRMIALLLSIYLVRLSMARAGMISVALITLVFCVCLRQYKLLVKLVALILLLVAVTGMLAPESLNKQLGDLTDAILYKGHKEEGVMGSRRAPWDESIASIKAHPFFGTGYGTSPTGADPGLSFGTVRSTAETAREHGSSYITITEWVGLFGVLPFILLLVMTMMNVWKALAWMRRNGTPRHYSIPLAMVVLAGLAHAGFEDWLFAVGSYLSLFFWVCAFLLTDFVPDAAMALSRGAVSRAPRPLSASYGTVLSNR